MLRDHRFFSDRFFLELFPVSSSATSATAVATTAAVLADREIFVAIFLAFLTPPVFDFTLFFFVFFFAGKSTLPI
jgi:hypothetical protein